VGRIETKKTINGHPAQGTHLGFRIELFVDDAEDDVDDNDR